MNQEDSLWNAKPAQASGASPSDQDRSLEGFAQIVAPRPLVFVGETRDRSFLKRIRRNGWGRMFSKGRIKVETEPWAFDNGAFGDWLVGDTILDPRTWRNK